MEIIDEGEVNTKKDIKVIEQRFIEERNPILNSISAST
jgi:hypothetical protein